ncbi:MAG: metallophosphoesterase [Lachnospiraceae bacterium]|jgi:putative phosphoesterase|nr:metallophosphoesterase [Lachnospiraceae bacterium]MBQ1608342.1 metallophosphoesterase [Lachnospiraceae bacterium]MBQ1720438.1 metallophosphoesterase [Lachnospiraceae bacterium]MBQ2316823.1 metallophosphoesterase [Lachnospiraceae bacterium]MBQ2466565.1 metallophosphoesterase [Lachnospiraceae bacterium]
MVVLVISDTHGHHENLQQVLSRVQPDMIYHLGDVEGCDKYIEKMAGCPLYVVRGNCDFNPELPDDLVLELGKHRIFLTHGHRYDVRFHNQKLVRQAKLRDCDMAFYGHTHCPELVYEEDVMVLNPGSITQPRQEGRRPSYAVLQVDDQGEITANIAYL